MDGVGQLINQLFWLFIIIAALQPVFQRKMLESARLRLIRRIEQSRGSRLIAMIHRQETMSLLGFPFFKYIDVHDSEEVVRAIRLTDKNVPIDFVLHTPGGLVLASLQIARALKRHPAKTTVFVPHYAMSGGTLIALAADEIVMDPNAVLGPVDPQLGERPAASVLRAVERKDINRVEDNTLILADVAEKAIAQVRSSVEELLEGKMNAEKARDLAEKLATGLWTHDHPITADEAKALGLPVSTDMPVELYQLMELYPQPVRHAPTVQYIPLPYRKAGKDER